MFLLKLKEPGAMAGLGGEWMTCEAVVSRPAEESYSAATTRS